MKGQNATRHTKKVVYTSNKDKLTIKIYEVVKELQNKDFNENTE